MPWCEDCAKYHAPSAMKPDGSCPTCGRVVDAPESPAPVTAKNLNLKKLAASDGSEGENEGAPWHFKLLMVLMVLYLVWRMVNLFR